MDKYYLISGKALANIQFRESKHWYPANQTFENEKICERDLTKYRRFLKLDEGKVKDLSQVVEATTTKKA